MQAFFLFLVMVFAIQVSAQRPEPVSGVERNQPLVDPTQLQGPPNDTEAPVVGCVNGLVLPMALSGTATLWAPDVLASISDNVTPVGELKIGIRKAGTGTGFPVDLKGNPKTTVLYNCAEMGLQQVELWAIDAAGNADNCTAEFQILDPFGYCSQNYDSVVVCVRYPCNDEPMPGVSYSVYVTEPPTPPTSEVTDSNGCGIVYMPAGATGTISLEKDDDPLLGVNALDMLLISKHILGLEPIANPYLLIAADANKSGSVTSFDIVEFKKLIKGIYTVLPNNTSWRFVEGSFQFPNPSNPFMTAFPEVITLSDGEELPDSVLFYGIKIGDMDCSASQDSLAPLHYPDANLVIKDTMLQAGQVYEMPIYMGSGGKWGGYQFALSFDSSKIEYEGVTSTQWSDAGDWAAFPGRLSTSWIHAEFPVAWQLDEPIAILRLKALQSLQLSLVMQLETNGLRAEAYQGQEAIIHDLILQFAPQFKMPEIPLADKATPVPDPAQLGDFAAPVITCINGLSANIMPLGMLNLWSTDFLQAVSDNATPVSAIELGIRRSGTGVGFPEGTLGLPISNVLFVCSELGTQSIEVWARDMAGNTSFCETYVVITDNLGNCNGMNQDWNLEICAKTEVNDAVEEVQYIVTGDNPTGPFYANQVEGPNSACGYFEVAQGSNIKVSVLKDDNPLNGVTTYDMVLIAKHVEGVEPLNSPYKIIAADVDKSGFVDSTDITELYKLILGIYTEFPNNASWRFVAKYFGFQDPSNPFLTPFPESIMIPPFTESPDFVAIKVGDVNGSATSNIHHQVSEERQSELIAPFIGRAYPNPTHAGAIIPVEWYKPATVNLSLYSLQGQLIWQHKADYTSGAYSLDIPAEVLSNTSGAYLWRLQVGDAVRFGKIAVE